MAVDSAKDSFACNYNVVMDERVIEVKAPPPIQLNTERNSKQKQKAKALLEELRSQGVDTDRPKIEDRLMGYQKQIETKREI